MSRAISRAKLKEADLLSAIRNRTDIRLFLLFGPDQSLAEDIGRKLAALLGPQVERVDIDAMTQTLDAGALADEAASLSLFGDRKFIRLRFTADRALAAIDTLLSAGHDGNIVIATAGNLTPANKTRKLVEHASNAMALGCYPPNESDAVAHIIQLARESGLALDKLIARRIVALTHGDRALGAMEVEKLALYLDASPGDQIAVPENILAELGAETAEENVSALIAAALDGRARELGMELSGARQMGVAAIRIVKAMQRRVAQLSGLTAAIQPGMSVEQFVERDRSIFHKDRASIIRELKVWNPPRLARLNSRLLDLEARMMRSGSSAELLLFQELATIARAAKQGR